MNDSVSVPTQTLMRVSTRMEWAAEYIGETGGRGHTADRVQELREYAAEFRRAAGQGDGDEPPEGYSVTHTSGGYYTVEDLEGNDVPGPANGKWQGREAAVVGAWAHHEG